MKNLSELFMIAREYGLVYIHTSAYGTYSCIITFNTIKHTELKAKSGFDHKTPEDAVLAAINTANEIMESLKKIMDKHKTLLPYESQTFQSMLGNKDA